MAANNSDVKGPSFTGLPEEIWIVVIEELDMPSIFALSQTCRRFRRLSDPNDKCRRHQLEAYLIQVQAFPRWLDGFACFSCLKVLPRANFSSAQTKQKRGRNGSQQYRRFCIRCGIDKNLYVRGSMVVQGGDICMVCRQCGQLRGGNFCQRCTICDQCDRSRGTLRTCKREGPYAGHKIICNPVEEASRKSDLCLTTALGLAFRMSAYEEATGCMASPEWFDGPDEIGP
jgi:hypothetical protein